MPKRDRLFITPGRTGTVGMDSQSVARAERRYLRAPKGGTLLEQGQVIYRLSPSESTIEVPEGTGTAGVPPASLARPELR